MSKIKLAGVIDIVATSTPHKAREVLEKFCKAREVIEKFYKHFAVEQLEKHFAVEQIEQHFAVEQIEQILVNFAPF